MKLYIADHQFDDPQEARDFCKKHNISMTYIHNEPYKSYKLSRLGVIDNDGPPETK